MKPAIELAKLAIAGEKAYGTYFPASAHDMAVLGSKVCAEEGVRYWIAPGGDSITCTKCRMTSRNANDVEKRYCGRCHEFLDEPAPQPHGAREAFAIFESMPTDQLLMLKQAHQIDLAEQQTPEGIVFGAGRLALIAEVLRKREVLAGQSQGR